MESNEAARRSLAAALKQALLQALRLIEEEDPAPLCREGGALMTSLATWRKTVDTQTSSMSIQRSRELENARLELLGRLSAAQKENADLQVRNKELLDQLVRVKQQQDEAKQRLLQAEFTSSGHKAEAKRLDLEVRELRRRLRALEGGPPLSAIEAAPHSKDADEPVAVLPEAATEPLVHAGMTDRAIGPAPQPVVLGSGRMAVEEAFKAIWKPKVAPVTPVEPPSAVAAAAEVPSRAPAAIHPPAPVSPIATAEEPARKGPPEVATRAARKPPRAKRSAPPRSVRQAPERPVSSAPRTVPQAAAKAAPSPGSAVANATGKKGATEKPPAKVPAKKSAPRAARKAAAPATPRRAQAQESKRPSPRPSPPKTLAKPKPQPAAKPSLTKKPSSSRGTRTASKKR